MTFLQSLRRRIPGALLSLALAAAFALFFCECNTPLGPSVGSDNAMYLTMGTALAQGRAPYRDIFDHKGPLLFLLQMLPQALSGGYSTLAVFLQEVVFLFASLRVLAAMARRLALGAGGGVALQLVYLACLGPAMDGGNLTEEYAALFTLAGLYVALRVFGAGDGLGGRHARRLFAPAALLGALAMLALMTRANNALALLGLTGALALCLLGARRPAALGACALGFTAGCLAAALPVVLWLAGWGALGDAFYGSILHNFMYAGTQGASRVQTLLCTPYGHGAMLLAALACAGALAFFLRTRRPALPLATVCAAAAAGFSAFISHKFYEHYLMVLSPVSAFGAALLLASLRGAPAHAPGGARPKRLPALTPRRAGGMALAALSLAVLLVCGAAANSRRLGDLQAQGTFAEDAQALYALVPEADRDDFMAYRVEPKWYVYTGALPCMRFYFLQEILAQADPAVMDEIVARFEQSPPKWLVLYYNRPFTPPYDERVAALFEAAYEFIDAKGQYQLLRLKEAT